MVFAGRPAAWVISASHPRTERERKRKKERERETDRKGREREKEVGKNYCCDAVITRADHPLTHSAPYLANNHGFFAYFLFIFIIALLSVFFFSVLI